MRLKLLEREQARLRDLVTRTTNWLRDNTLETTLQIETAVGYNPDVTVRIRGVLMDPYTYA